MRSWRRARWALVLAVAVIAPLTTAVAAGADGAVELRVLSNRADLVSEGDALVEVVLPDSADPSAVRVDVDGRDVTDAFAVRADGRYLGRIEGLALGVNVVTAQVGDGAGARLPITNHAKGGPIFSGAQIQPWICTTANAGLGEPLDAQCNGATRYDFFYVAEGDDGFAPYDPANPPSDVGTTTTDQGKTVPFIIRQETGTQNRGIYRIATLYDPAKPFEPWDRDEQGWNAKLFYPFGASCGTAHTQGSAQGVQSFNALSRGFMVATSSLNVLGSSCNTVVSAESVMMVKERIVERYGEIRYTFGQGGSGGAIGQNQVANTYPGLLQGLTTTLSYPDPISTGAEVLDCHLLFNYFVRTSPHLWANVAQQTAVTGHGTSPATCIGWEAFFANTSNPRTGCGGPPQYDPATNPTGCRGTYQDFNESIFGKRPESIWTEPEKLYGGFAKALYGNVGVEYGLQALRDGIITTEQFVDLNEKIGAFDVDFDFTDERAVPDDGATETIYRTGQLNDGAQLDEVAIIDSRSTGNIDALTIHTMHHSFALKDRMVRSNGHADNHVLWRGSSPYSSFDVMDAWLTAAEADARDVPWSQKLVDNKPPEARDQCWAARQRFTNRRTCDELWPYYGAPRTVAGAPRSHDVQECQLKPLDRDDDYGLVPFTDAQWARLEAVFADGVCDYSKPSQFASPSTPWTTFAAGPGGQPLGPPPASQSL